MVMTGSKFPSLYDSVCQIPQRDDTNLCPAPLIVILQACNLRQISDKIYTFRAAKDILGLILSGVYL